jgi:hypothetical protein
VIYYEKTFWLSGGQSWDGDEEIIHYLEDKLLTESKNGFPPKIKNDVRIKLEITLDDKSMD